MQKTKILYKKRKSCTKKNRVQKKKIVYKKQKSCTKNENRVQKKKIVYKNRVQKKSTTKELDDLKTNLETNYNNNNDG